MIVSTNVSHVVKICPVLTILHQLISRGVTNFGTWCILYIYHVGHSNENMKNKVKQQGQDIH